MAENDGLLGFAMLCHGAPLARRWKGDDFRAFVHPAAALEAIVQEAGFRRLSRSGT